MDQREHDSLADLEAQYAASLREKVAAIAELSASLFNRPHLHDAYQSTPAYLHWQVCGQRARQLEDRISALKTGDGKS